MRKTLAIVFLAVLAAVLAAAQSREARTIKYAAKNNVLSCVLDGAGLPALGGSQDRRQYREKDDCECFPHSELLARISKPFSNPCSRNACSRRKLSFGSLV